MVLKITPIIYMHTIKSYGYQKVRIYRETDEGGASILLF
jgi:hypothetical protein